MMLNIFVIASTLSVVCGTQYAYYDNNLIEFDDPPTQTVSLPYPYYQPKAVKLEQRPLTYDVGLRPVTVSNPSIVEEPLEMSSPFGLICSMTTKIFGFVKKIIFYLFKSIPALIFGCFSAGVCKLASICKLLNIKPSYYIDELTSYVTPERMKRATEFVESAFKKYKELQNA